ncbi:MAG: hypothetical protein MMC33_004083 [Icmadophila ericetorum]|nr:hypothetical protein [Icmadophila ericetorum]
MQTSLSSNRKRSHWSLDVDENPVPQNGIKRTCIEVPRGSSYDSISDNGGRRYKSLPRRRHPGAYAPSMAGNGIASPSSTSSSSSSSDSRGDSDSESIEDLSSDSESESASSPSQSESSSRSRSASTSSRLSNDPISLHIPTLTALPRPQIADLQSIAPEASSLQSRLSSFIPSLAAANQELEYERREGRIVDRDIENLGNGGEGTYIEMNLGLGVLEEKGSHDSDTESVSSMSSSSSSSSSPDSNVNQDGASLEAGGKEKDVLGKLMGRERNRDRPTIQIVDC